MADVADKSVDTFEMHLQGCLADHQAKMERMPKPRECEGYCEFCGNWFTRLVVREYKGEDVAACGGCRDKYKIG